MLKSGKLNLDKLLTDKMDNSNKKSHYLILEIYSKMLLSSNANNRIVDYGEERLKLKKWEMVVNLKQEAKHYQIGSQEYQMYLRILEKYRLIKIKTLKKCGYWYIRVVNEIKSETEGQTINKTIKASKVSACELIRQIKTEADKLGVVYNPFKEAEYVQKILNCSSFLDQSQKMKLSVIELTRSVLKLSVEINYWKWPLTWPKGIYENYADLLNKANCEHSMESNLDEIDRYIHSQPPEIKSRLMSIKKQRMISFPYKRPFASIEHVDMFISAIKEGKL